MGMKLSHLAAVNDLAKRRVAYIDFIGAAEARPATLHFGWEPNHLTVRDYVPEHKVRAVVVKLAREALADIELAMRGYDVEIDAPDPV